MATQYTVYKAENLVNGAVYFGMTSLGLNKRAAHHFYARRQGRQVFPRAIARHGIENFVFNELYIFDNKRDAEDMERLLIAELNPEYNIAPGGAGVSYWAGKTRDQETKKKISATKKAAGCPRPSDEIIENLKLLGAKNSKERAKPVRLINDGRIFPSSAAAAKEFGITLGEVSRVAKDERASTHKMRFEYA